MTKNLGEPLRFSKLPSRMKHATATIAAMIPAPMDWLSGGRGVARTERKTSVDSSTSLPSASVWRTRMISFFPVWSSSAVYLEVIKY